MMCDIACKSRAWWELATGMMSAPNEKVNLGRVLLAVSILVVLLGTLLYFWNSLINPSSPDVLGVTISYFLDPAKLVWLWTNLLFGPGSGPILPVHQGSGPFIKFNLLFIFGFLGGFLIQRTLEGQYLWTSPGYLIYAVIVTIIGSTINGIAQAEEWYWNFATNSPGNFDVGTHFIAGLIIGSWLVNTNFMNMFGFEGKAGELWEQFMVIAIFGVIAVGFEIIESLDPSRYLNIRGNSIQDMIVGVAGILVASWVYDKLVDWVGKAPKSGWRKNPNG